MASLGAKLGVIQILWLGYGVFGGIGLGIGYITPVSTLVKWFPDRRGMATGLAIMGFGFGTAIGGPVYNCIMSKVAAGKVGMAEADFRAGISNLNSSRKLLKAIHVNDEATAGYGMGGGFGSRITSNIREDKGYTYSPFSFVGSWPKTGLWVEVADVTTNVTGPALKEIFYEVDRLRNEAPPDQELAGIKNNMVGLFTVQNSSRGGVINQLQFVDQYGLGDSYLSNYVKNVLAVTPEQVRQAATRYLDPGRMTITVVGDKKVVETQLEPYRSQVP